MNSNRQRHWMLADAADWAGDGSLVYDAATRRLALAQRRPDALFAADPGLAEAALLRVPHTLDEAGARVWFELAPDNSGRLMSLGLSDAARPQIVREGLGSVTDLAFAETALLFVAEAGLAGAGNLRVIDPLARRPEVVLQAMDFAAWRIAAAPTGGVWALDRVGRQLARATGAPLPPDPVVYAATTARPCRDNPNPPRLAVLDQRICADDESPVALACHPVSGTLAVLVWRADGQCDVVVFDAAGRFLHRAELSGLRRAHSIAWFDENRIACLVAGAREAPVFDLSQLAAQPVAALEPSGDFHPLRHHDGGPFVNTRSPRAQILVGAAAPEARRVRPLAKISLPAYLPRGEAHNDRALDSENPGQLWHRLYLEAHIPDGCGISVWLAASEAATPSNDTHWFEHRFGATYPRVADVPHGVWQTDASELPHHPGFLGCAELFGAGLAPAREPHRAGLFSLLIQRAGQQVRALSGRFLHVRIELTGNGRASPSVAALRAWGERFSYVEHYLPEFYREAQVGDAREQSGAATGADFLERSLGNFEGVLTQLEDRIASAHLLTDARTTPDDALPWLGRWIGLAFDPAWPLARRRALLAAAPELYRSHGTLAGLQRALEVASGGGVTRGDIVVFEDFRFRRTFATILGADLADEYDPLFDGLVASGNSFVGDTLFLGAGNEADPGVPAPLAGLRRFARAGANGPVGLTHAAVALPDRAALRTGLQPGLLTGLRSGLLPGLQPAERAELAALFTPDAGLARESSVQQFHEQLAWRATVLVRTPQAGDLPPGSTAPNLPESGLPEPDSTAPDLPEPDSTAPDLPALALLRRIAELASPAHVAVRVEAASAPLVVGLASLIGLDTRLEARPAVPLARLDDPRRAGTAVGQSRVGRGALRYTPITPPVADAGDAQTVGVNQPFVLSAERSRAGGGRSLVRFSWLLRQ